MEIFIAICIDRHIDEVVRVFTTAEKAIKYCKNFIPEHSELEIQELNSSMKKDGWIFYGTYSCESDSVRVEKSILNPSE